MSRQEQTIKIGRFSDSVGGFSSECSGGFHHVAITIPNENVSISTDGDAITVRAKWDKTRFQMPVIEKGIYHG